MKLPANTKLEEAFYLIYSSGLSETARSHSIRVLDSLVVSGETDETTLVAALLHDVVEDTYIELSTILEKFGHDVYMALYYLTHDPNDTYEKYIDGLWHNSAARKVKVHDIIDNLTRTDDIDPKRKASLKIKYTKALVTLSE